MITKEDFEYDGFINEYGRKVRVIGNRFDEEKENEG